MEEGAYTVLMTPFNIDTSSIDFVSYENLLNKQYESDITGVVVLGTTSESPTLTYDEKLMLVKIVWDKLHLTKKIVVGVGGNNTLETLQFANEIQDYCHYIMVTVPNYNKPTQAGICEHFLTICQNVTKPCIIYNIPSRCGVNMLPETLKYVYDNCKNIIAVKESSNSLNQILHLKNICNKIQIFSGDDGLIIPVMAIGGVGVISVAGNILPDTINELYQLCKKNKYEEANKLYCKLHNIIQTLFIETNPVPGKRLLELCGIINHSIPRLPLVKMSYENEKKVYECYKHEILNMTSTDTKSFSLKVSG